MMMADQSESIVERILHHLGWHSAGDDAADLARLRDQERRLKALETRIAVQERADREAIAALDRIDAEEKQRGHR